MSADLVAKFQAIENHRTRWLLAGEFDAVEAMLADDLIYGHSTGLVDDKQSLMAGMRKQTVRYRTITSTIAQAVEVGEGVVMTHGVIAIEAAVNGEEGRFGGQFMQVWRRSDGRWLLQGLQANSTGLA